MTRNLNLVNLVQKFAEEENKVSLEYSRIYFLVKDLSGNKLIRK